MAGYELNPQLFEKAVKDDQNADKIRRPSIKYWPDVWRRLKQNKLAMFGLILILLMAIMSFVGTKLSGYEYFEQDLTLTNVKPNSEFWFGTDELGRDMFTRVWYGARYSLAIGIIAAAIDFLIGVAYGGIAGMASRRVDSIMMRLAEIAYSIPLSADCHSIFRCIPAGGWRHSMFIIILAMSITGWVPMAILVRGQVLQLKESEYSLASES